MGRYRTEGGVVIRRANVGEADRILTFLTPHGKLAAVARGVRKFGSRKAGALELFTVVRFLLADRPSLPIIQEVELVEAFPSFRTNLEKVAHAYWAGELVDRLVGEDEGPTGLYHEFLGYLERLERGTDLLDIHVFELIAMRELGWQPELGQCVSCAQTLAGEQFGWSNRLGGVLGSGCCTYVEEMRPLSRDTIKVLRLLVNRGLGLGADVRIPAPIGQEVATILHGYLETLGERKWKSPELFVTAN